MINVKIFRYTF